ncbi:MAG: putative Ig domain-containing protein [Burkholderiales bacterium]|nr:putative Ig domain-containing protein [Burkholderiales bacterium]
MLATGALVALASGCGGGGGVGTETLYVEFAYPTNSTIGVLRVPLTSTPHLDGLEGHSPHCALSAGALPPGLTLADNCVISGAPQAAGTFAFTVRLTASGVKGSVEASGGFTISDPSPVLTTVRGTVFVVDASIDQQFTIGLPVGLAQTLGPLPSPDPGDVMTFAVVSGTLPPGMVIDPATGGLTGTPTQLGRSTFNIGATLQRSGIVYTSNATPVVVYVSPVVAQVTYPSCPAVWAVAWTCAPTVAGLPPGATVGAYSAVAIPAGFAIDPATGTLSGTPVAPGDLQFVAQTSVTLADSLSYVMTPVAFLARAAPSPSWGSNDGDTSNMTGVIVAFPTQPTFGPGLATIWLTVNQPFTVDIVAVNGSLPGDLRTFSIVPYADHPLPSWVTIDPLTGRLQGAPPPSIASGFAMFTVNLATTRNGRTASRTYVWQFIVP